MSDVTNDIGNTIPEQKEGSQSNIEESIEADNEEQAKKIFVQAKNRLLSVNCWKEISGDISASFTLTNEQGNRLTREAQPGDYLKIDIPGPGSKTGEGYDWVKVEAVENKPANSSSDEGCVMRVRPSANPTDNDDKVAHFFDENATSNFIVEREGRIVRAKIYGRNEKPNTDTHKPLDNLRNAVIGGTAASGLSFVQWKKLAKGLIE